MKALSLLPQPQQLVLTQGNHTLEGQRRIVLEEIVPTVALSTAQRLQEALRLHADVEWSLAASALGVEPAVGIRLRVAPSEVPQDQGYTLSIAPNHIDLTAHDPAGLFYGVTTLIQIIEQRGAELPCLRITDWPDFPVRGVMLDVSRDKVPTLETLRDLIDLLAGWKINQIQLYTEHTFTYYKHPEVWANASPITGQDIIELDAFCRERHIELVPNQNTFGHMRRWLVLDTYRDLAEAPDGCETRWGWFDEPFSLNPLDPRSIALVDDMLDELLPHFSSTQVNVGCDETVDLGAGRSKAVCEERGVGRVYLEFLQKIYATVKRRGSVMQFWGDIILEHPELIAEMPKDVIALNWGYEATHPFALESRRFADSGIPFYVCPGTSSWCSIAGRTENALGNLRSAAENGLQNGALGYLITDWGDLGHWQPLPVSYLGFAAGAAFSWAYTANRDRDVAEVVSWHAFRDSTGAMGRLAYDLGNIYRVVGLEPGNSSVLFWAMQYPIAQLRENKGLPNLGFFRFASEEVQEHARQGLTAADFERTQQEIDRVMAGLETAQMERFDADLIIREFELTATMLRHGCMRGRLAVENAPEKAEALLPELDNDMQRLIEEYQEVWLARNRPGGLADSVARFEAARADYRS